MISSRTAQAVVALILSVLAQSIAPACTREVPYHVETWAGYHYGGVDEGVESARSTMWKWVTYLDGGWPYNRDVCDVRGHPCQTVDYINASNQYFGECGWSAAVVYGGLTQQHTLAESAWLHVKPPLAYATRIFNNHYTRCVAGTANTGLFINKKSVSGAGNALAFFNTFLNKRYRQRWPDYLMNDDVDLFNNLWPTRLSAYEYRSWLDLQNAQAAFLGGEVNKNGKPQNLFFNGCGDNPAAATGVTLVKMRANIVGCITEDNVNSSAFRNGRVLYSLDNCARVTLNPNGGIFVNGPNSEGGVVARRRATAFNMLCYVPGREVFWEEEEWGSKYVNVFPEEGIYPTLPIQSMRMPAHCPDEELSSTGPGNDGAGIDPCKAHGHNDLLISGTKTVERREFAKCYNRGKHIGRCAVILNADAWPVSVRSNWLTQRYAHTMDMNGGTIDAAGTVTLTKPITPAGTSIAGYDALFLFE